MGRLLKLVCLTVLACALCAVFTSPAFAWTGSMWPAFQYPAVVPTPPNPADAALLAGSSEKAQDGWEQVYITGDAYQRGFQDGYLTAQNADYFIWMYAIGSDQLTWPSGTYGVGTPTKGAAAIKYECMSGVAIWPLIPVEYQQELEGMADGMAAWFQAEGLTCPDNLWDVVTSNASTGDDYGVYTTGGTITAASAASPTVITTANPNGLVSGMTVTIAGSNSTPSINGSYPVTVIDSRHFRIPVAVTTAGTAGKFTTATPPPIPASPSHGVEVLPPVSKAVQAAEKTVKPRAVPKNRCSSFVATGPDWTTDGKMVVGHDSWFGWDENYEANIMLYVHPTDPSGNPCGYDMDFQTFGANIWCGQDYYANSSGLGLTETTINDSASSPGGIPIFVRAREAIQYASTCHQAAFSRTVDNYYTEQDTPAQGGEHMGFQAGTPQSNGAYANEWLIGDSTGRIASLQLGTLAYDLHESTDGFFGSCNWTWGPNVLYENSKGVPTPNGSGSVAPGTPPARWKRWLQIEAQYRGKGAIDAEVAMQIMGDDFDTTYGLAHHGDSNCLVGTTSNPWPAAPAHYGITTALTGIPPALAKNSSPSATTTKYYRVYPGLPAAKTSDGSDLDGKVTTESMCKNGLQVWARWGYADGMDFFNKPYPQNVTDYFAAHPNTYTIAASPSGATESGNSVTITTTATNAVAAGANVTVSGVPVAGYNGTFAVAAVLSATQFTYTDPTSGLAASGGGSVSQAMNPATSQEAWEINAMASIVDSGPGGNQMPWTLMGEAVSASGVPAHSITGNVNVNGWTNQPVHITFSLQGTWTSVMYNVDNNGWTAGSSLTIPAPANGSNDGVHTVDYYAADASGTGSPTQTCQVYIDTRAPTTVATNAPTGWVNRRTVTVNLRASDARSGVGMDWYRTGTYHGTHGTLPLYRWAPTTWYSVDHGPYTEGTRARVRGQGVHTLSFYSTDNAGNKAVAKSVTIKIDTTGPTTVAQPASGRKGKAITLKYLVRDNLSPRATAVTLTIRNAHKKLVKRFALGTKNISTWYVVRWTPKAKGSYRYTVYAKDLAGNKQIKAGSAKITVK